tara:strand:+ start:310 stop:570 length:261 start_codon:yes stop_codon:yes gene_type:complete
MSKLQKERLNQMIENALSYKQEVKKIQSNSLYKRLKDLILKPNVYGLTFTSVIISCIFIPQLVISRNIVDVNEINDFVTYAIIEDL